MEILILSLSILIFLLFWQDRRNKAEEKKFREFVIAIKTKTAEEYVQTLPASDDPLPKQKNDEFEDLSKVEPKKLLKIMQ